METNEPFDAARSLETARFFANDLGAVYHMLPSVEPDYDGTDAVMVHVVTRGGSHKGERVATFQVVNDSVYVHAVIDAGYWTGWCDAVADRWNRHRPFVAS